MKVRFIALGLALCGGLQLFAATYAELMAEGERHRAAGESSEALRSYRLAAGVTLDLGQAARAWYRMGQVLEGQQEWDGAEQDYYESLQRKRYPETEQAIARIEGRKVGRVVSAPEIVRSLGPAAKKSQVLVPSINLFVNFDFDKDTLTPEGMNQVAELAKAVSDAGFEGSRFELVGHTDRKGTDAYNQALSERRANRVRQVLVSQFQEKDSRFDTRGMGFKQPLSTGTEDKDDRLNRRVEVRLLEAN